MKPLSVKRSAVAIVGSLMFTFCASLPRDPDAVSDHRDVVVYVRATCPEEYHLFFRKFEGLAHRMVLDCSEYSGRLIAFEGRRGFYELVLRNRFERNAFVWTENLFEAKDPGTAYYWGDITVASSQEVRISKNPATETEIAKARAGGSVYGVTRE